MARPWVLAAAALWLAALAHSPRTTAFAAGAVNRRGSVGGAALLENAKNCVFMFQVRQRSLRRTEPPRRCLHARPSAFGVLTREPTAFPAQGEESYTYMLQARGEARPRVWRAGVAQRIPRHTGLRG